MSNNEKRNPSIEIDADIMDEAVSSIEKKGKDQDHQASDDNKETQASDEQKKSSSDEDASDDAPEEQKEVDYKDRFIRLSADFDNYRKRILKEKSSYIKYGNESLLKELLPVLDNFERAIETSADSSADTILEGVKMIYFQLNQTLEKFGLKGQNTEGQSFDPNLHEAMSNVEDDSVEHNTIVEEHQKMYHYHEKLLRPALVTVSKKSDADSEDDENS